MSCVPPNNADDGTGLLDRFDRPPATPAGGDGGNGGSGYQAPVLAGKVACRF